MKIEITHISDIEMENTKRDVENGNTPDLIETYWDEWGELDFEYDRRGKTTEEEGGEEEWIR